MRMCQSKTAAPSESIIELELQLTANSGRINQGSCLEIRHSVKTHEDLAHVSVLLTCYLLVKEINYCIS